jgi:hypothetical protein
MVCALPPTKYPDCVVLPIGEPMLPAWLTAPLTLLPLNPNPLLLPELPDPDLDVPANELPLNDGVPLPSEEPELEPDIIVRDCPQAASASRARMTSTADVTRWLRISSSMAGVARRTSFSRFYRPRASAVGYASA